MSNEASEIQSPPQATPSTLPALDMRAFVADRSAEHREILGERIVRLRRLAADAAAANPQLSDIVTMDQKIALLCNDLRDCFGREDSMVFPAIARLAAQTSVSKCHAGMIRARLRFTVAEQDALVSTLTEACDTAHRHLSPAGPCEFCHQLLVALQSLAGELSVHVRREQDELFEWALAREDWLIGQIGAGDDPDCL